MEFSPEQNLIVARCNDNVMQHRIVIAGSLGYVPAFTCAGLGRQLPALVRRTQVAVLGRCAGFDFHDDGLGLEADLHDAPKRSLKWLLNVGAMRRRACALSDLSDLLKLAFPAQMPTCSPMPG